MGSGRSCVVIDVVCLCGLTDRIAEYDVARPWLCPGCGRRGSFVCAEKLPEDAGAGDFDIRLHVTKGPARIGEFFQLGGIAEIEIGSSLQGHIVLAGHGVSTHHCRLKRVDFGPSRWELTDLKTPGGTFINSQRATAQEIKPGDIIQIGDFTIQCDLADATARPVATAVATARVAKPLKAAGSTVAKKPVAKAQGRAAIDYAHPEQEIGERPLGECDISWVMSIRNGARLASYAATPVIVAFYIPLTCIRALIIILSLPFSAIALGVSGWFLSAKEPGVKENPFWTVIRLLLKVTGTATGIAIPLFFCGLWLKSPEVVSASGFCMLAVPVYMFLYLFYMRKLASRLPNTGMAVACILLMVALPTSLGMVLYGAVTHALSGGAGGEVSATIVFFVMQIMLLAYVGILFWFNRSFS
jgi:hypothetical protein